MNKQNPIIFLDIDGVLNHHHYYKSPIRSRTNIDAESVKRLNELTTLGAKVVISSTWRLNRSIEELQAILNEHGFVGEIIGKTLDMRYEDNGDCILRGNEILQWIKAHPEVCGAAYWDYKRYVIFDDDSDMLYWQKDNYIHVDPFCGLSPHNVFHAKKILSLTKPNEIG